jgi:hypothetical protein
VEKRMKVGADEEVELWGEEVEIENEREMVRERREKGLGWVVLIGREFLCVSMLSKRYRLQKGTNNAVD